MRVAVVGHVEWVEFARVPRVPAAGEIAHASRVWKEPAGGGAVAAVQLARLAGECLFFTALGDDEFGRAAERELAALGVRLEVAWRTEPQRRAFVFLDDDGERTITTLGRRLEPRRADRLPWEELAEVDAVYLTACDAAAARAARTARKLVATPRAIEALREAAVRIDVLVSSTEDAGEQLAEGQLEPPPALIARSGGARGGSLQWADGRKGGWEATPLPGAAVDSYGCGDCFAAGVAYGLAQGRSCECAVALGARCGAACRTGAGPYEGQLHELP